MKIFNSKIWYLVLLCGTISLKVFGGNIDKSTLFEVQIDGADTFVEVLNQFDIPIHTVQISLDIKKSINNKKIHSPKDINLETNEYVFNLETKP